jgi:hypothetical protein
LEGERAGELTRIHKYENTYPVARTPLTWMSTKQLEVVRQLLWMLV